MATRTTNTANSNSGSAGGAGSAATPGPSSNRSASARSSSTTVIGASVQVRGTVSGDEDLQVFGRIEGRVDLEHTLTVEDSGVIKADVSVKTALISGVVVGNITASESVHLLRGARMVGDIAAPRVILADGASFRGSVDMGDMDSPPARKASSARAHPAPAPRPAAAASSSTAASTATVRPRTSVTPSPTRPQAPAAVPSPSVTARPAEQRPAEKPAESVRPAPAAMKPAVSAPTTPPLEAPPAKGLPEKAKTRVIVKRK